MVDAVSVNDRAKSRRELTDSVADSVVVMATNRMKSASRSRRGASSRGQKTGMGSSSTKRRTGRRTAAKRTTGARTRRTAGAKGGRARRGRSLAAAR